MKERMIHITGNDLGFNLCHLFRIYGQILQLCAAGCVMVRCLVTDRYLIVQSYSLRCYPRNALMNVLWNNTFVLKPGLSRYDYV